MIEKILFSPIGKSDPVNAYHDGGWIHCCRQFKPDLAVVYLSAEMIPRENEKHFFSGTLELLGEHIKKKIAFEKIERPKLDNPQDFEAFYDDFEEILVKCHKEYPDAEILINVSSGTPAMKGCLIHLYHMLPFPVKLIQVFGPHEEMSEGGKRHTVPDDYNVEEGWKTNKDNLTGTENRCYILKDQQQAIRLRVMQLKTLVSHHEYSAALMLAESEELKEFMPVRLLSALKAAVSRMQLDLQKAGAGFKGLGFEDGGVIFSHYNELVYQGTEMLLTMEVDLQRDDISSCLRKVTPVLLSLMVAYLAKLGFNVEEILDKSKMFIKESKFQEKYPDVFNSVGYGFFNKKSKYPDTCYINSDNLIKILDYKCSNQTQEKKNISWFRDLEMKVRNEIAHKPVKMTEALFKERTGYGSDEIIKRGKKTYELLNSSLFNSTYWRSYERMKKFILDSAVIEK